MPITGYSDPVYDAIKTKLTSDWTATAILWPDDDVGPVGADPVVAVDLVNTFYSQQSLGVSPQSGNRWDRDGTLFLHVTAPRGTSFTNVSGAGKALADIFRGLTLLSGNLEFGDASLGGSIDQDGPWYVVSVSIEWRYINA